jgi:23S rRNA pseudouridine1911/1915/1917 synthase
MSEPEKIETRLEIAVPPGYREYERLDLYLTNVIQNATRAKVQKGIKEGHVTVNGKESRKPSSSVQPGDFIVCTIMKSPPVEIIPEDIALDIVYEDEDLLVVNKQAGMVVHPAFGHRTGTLVHALLHHVGGAPIVIDSEEDGEDADSGDTDDEPDETGLSTINADPRFEGDVVLRPGIVHRLDKDTSGLLVVAKNDVAHAALARQFMNRTTRRRYEAIVWGIPTPESSTIITDLARDPHDRRKVGVVKEGGGRSKVKGKRAVTHYTVIEKFGYCSLVEFRLETGRTHQIRVHAAHIGNPIFGDTTYGGDRIRYGKDEGQRRTFYRNLFQRLPRQALHARSLGFKHPRTGEEMDFEVSMPEDMTHVVSRLRSFDLH